MAKEKNLWVEETIAPLKKPSIVTTPPTTLYTP